MTMSRSQLFVHSHLIYGILIFLPEPSQQEDLFSNLGVVTQFHCQCWYQFCAWAEFLPGPHGAEMYPKRFDQVEDFWLPEDNSSGNPLDLQDDV